MLTPSQFLKIILHGRSSIEGDPAGRRASKATLWGLTATTPGMIALAATVVSTVSSIIGCLYFNLFSYCSLLLSAAQTSPSLPKEGQPPVSTGAIDSLNTNT